MGNMYNLVSTATHLQQQNNFAGQSADNDVRKRCTIPPLQASLLQPNHTASFNQNLIHMQMPFTTKNSKPKIGLKKWLICLAMLTLAIILPFSKAMSQSPSLYSFAGSTGTYTTVTGTTLGASSIGDDVGIGNLPIGFNFVYNGTTFTIFGARSNGLIELGQAAATLSGFSANALATTANCIAPIWDDNNTTGSTIIYTTTGTPGSQVLTVQWTGMHVGNGGLATNPTINVQLKLFEGTNVIQFIYGTTSAAFVTTTASIGISGNSGNFLSVTPLSPANTSTVSSVTENTTISTATNFPSGTIYTFTPPPPCAAPVDQATGLTVGATTFSTIPGSFTAAASVPSGYLVVRYPNGAATTNPVNATTYTAGNTLGLGTVVASGATTSYTATGVAAGTTYNIYVYSFNNTSCTGGPVYNTTSVPTVNAITPSGTLSGTFTVGTGGTYNNLTTAFAAINASGLSGNVDLQLITGYPAVAETFPIATATEGAGGGFTIKVYPTVSGLTIGGAGATGILNFNGAAKITIDGRVNQTGLKNLIISNTTNAGGAYAIQFINGANNNIIQHTTIRSSNTSTTGGTIVFAGSTTSNGNSNNTIDNNDILEATSGTTFPINAIYAAGQSASIVNTGNIVSNNNIANYFSAASLTSGILLTATGNSAWSITNNRLYQTATRIYTTANTHNGIGILGGSGYTITGNTIGFANSAGTGTTNLVGNSVALTGTFPTGYTTTGTATATRFIAINLAFTAAGTVSNIQGNTVAGIALYTSSGATTTNGILCGINLTAGNANIGTTTANTIGAATGNSAIYAACTTSGGAIVGIYATSANTVSIQNNIIGAIDASGSSATTSGSITGIDVAGAGNFTVSSNLIGNTTANNLRAGYFFVSAQLSNNNATAVSTTGTSAIIGVRSTMTGNVLAINSNTLRGWFAGGTATSITGIISSGAMTGTTPSATVNTNALGTASLDWVNFSFANSGTLTGISLANTIATTHSMQTNDIRRIVYAVASSGTHTYLTCTGGTAASNVTTIANNTFTNLIVNTTGSVTFISHGSTVAATGTQTINNNSIVTAFSKTGVGGTISGLVSNSSSVLGAICNHTNNNFSNITATGATAITGVNNTDGGTGATRAVTGNTFSNWTTGAGTIIGMSYGYFGGASAVSSNTVTSLNGQGAITGINIGSSANAASPLTVASNTITSLLSTGTGGSVSGIVSANTSPIVNINGNAITTLSSTGVSSTVLGISITGATATSVFLNTISGLSTSGTTSPIVNGISVSGGTLVNVHRNKIVDLSASAAIATTNGAINGILLSGGTTVNTYNNIIGNLTAPAANLSDAIRGISVTSSTATTTQNVINNTVRLAASSSGAVFGTTGVFHTASATATTATLNLRNNIIINLSTPNGAGVVTALRRSAAATLGNYGAASNKNLLYAGTPSANNTVMHDGTTAFSVFGPAATVGSYQNTITPRDGASFTNEGTYDYTAVTGGTQFFQSITSASTNFLHILAGITTQVEGGADAFLSSPDITLDFDGDARSSTKPDIGADEFVGTSPSPVITNVTVPAAVLCVATARTINADIVPTSGTLTSVTLTYNNGSAGSVAMTLTSGTTYTGVIPVASPANSTVTWSISATNSGGNSSSVTGTSYADEPLTNVALTTSVTPTGSVCAGTAVSLSASLPASSSIGTQTTTEFEGPYRLGFGTGDYRHQFLLTAAELTAAGIPSGTNLNSLSFTVTSVGSGSATNYTIKMANVASTVLSSTFATGTFTTCYVASSITPVTGVNNYLFSTPFTWNGTSNVLVDICYTVAVTGSTSTVAATTPAFLANASLKASAGACAATTGATTFANRPLMAFTYNGFAPYTLKWNNGTSDISTTTTATANPVANTTYTFTITRVSDGCTKTSTQAVTVLALPDAPTVNNSINAQCGLAVPTVSVQGGSNGLYRWYLASTGGTALAGEQNSALTAYQISTTTTFYVSITDGTCESLRTPIVANVATADPITAVANAQACINGNVVLTANQTGSNQNYTYTWSATPATGSGIPTTVVGNPTTVVPTATGTYIYAVSANDGGCNSSSTVTVTVNALPLITSSSATPASICVGQNTSLTAASVFSSAYTNTAVGAGALTTSASGTSSVNYASPYSHYYGGYKAQYVVRASELIAAGINGGTISSLAFDVTTASTTSYTGFTINLAQSSAAINTSVATSSFLTPTFTQVYTGNPTPSTVGLNTYAFGTGAGSSTSFTWNGTSDIVVQVCWSNNNGGGTAAEVKYDNTTFVSNGYYRVDNATQAAVCAIATATSTASIRPKMVFTGVSINNLTSSLTWSWAPGALSGSTVSASPSADQTYTVTALNTTTTCSATADVAVTVKALPTAPVIASNNEQCGPGAPTATIVSGGTGGNGTFNWYSAATGGTLLQSSTSATYATSISASTSFYVSESGTNGCESARTQVDVVVTEADPLTLASSASPVCINGTITLITTQGGGNNSFDFTYSAVAATGSGIPTPVVTSDFTTNATPTVAGTYVYSVTGVDASNGCTSVATTTVVVNTLPIIDSVKATATAVCEGSTVTLSGYSSLSTTGSQVLPTGYAASNATSIDDEELLNVSLGTAGSLLNNSSTCATTGGIAANGLPASVVTQYSNYTALTAPSINAGASIPVSLTLGTCGGNFGRSATVYIDYNRNGAFDLPAEQAYFTGSIASTVGNPIVKTGTIVIPPTASAGVTLMRVVYNESTTAIAPNVTYTWGETEDYKLNIIGVNTVNPSLTYTWNPGAIVASSTTVTPPVGTTVYALTVADAIGCTSTTGTAGNPASISVLVNPNPSAPSVTPSTQCGTGVPTASAIGTGGTLKWYSALTGGTLLQTGGTTYTTSIAATTDFFVAETSAAGCEGPRTQVTATVTAPPTLAITPSGTTTLCSGQSVGLDAATGSDPSYTSFAWSSPTSTAALSSTTTAASTANPTVTTTYIVTATGAGCSNTASITVTVNPLPVITSATASVSTVCVGGTTNLIATSLGASGNGTIGTATTTVSTSGNPYRSGNGVGNQIRTQLLVTAAQLTTAGIPAGNLTSLSFNSTSTTGTLANLEISLGATSATALSSTFETSSTTSVFTAATYTPVVGVNTHTFSTPFTWDGSSNILVNICQTNSIIGTTALSAFTSPTVADNHQSGTTTGCTDATGVTSTPMPVITFGYINDNTSAFTWLWNPGAIAGSTVTVNPAISTSYTVTATNPTTTCVSAPSTVAITVQSVGATASVTPTTPICVGGSVTLNGVGTGGGPFTYSWSDGTSVVGSSASLVVSPIVTTTYTLTVTDACSNSIAATPITVTVNTLPTITINEAGGAVCAPSVYDLTSTTNATSPAYQWFRGATTLGGTTLSTLTATITGAYTVRVTDGTTGCVKVSDPITVTINPKPGAITISPAAPTVCSGTGVLLTATGGVAAVDGTVAVGTGVTTTSTAGITPFNSNWEGSRTQYLVKASELTALGLTAGNLTSVAFDVTAAGTGTFAQSGFSIKIGHTTDAAMSSTVYSTPVSGFTTCFGPATVAAPTVGLRTFTFTTPFAWDGTTNILIDICHDNDITATCASCFSGSSTVKYTATTYNSVFGRYNDNAQACGVNASTALTTGFTNRPNMIFAGQVGTTSAFTWAANATLSTTTGAITTATPIATSTYTVTATSVAGCTNTADVTITTTPVTSFTSNAAPLSQTLLVNDPSPSAITVAATGTGTVTYAWFSNTTNSNTGGTSLGVTTPSYTPSSATAGTKYYYCVATSDCGSLASAVATVVVTNANSWKGGGTTEWTTTTNWSTNQVPTASTDGIIPVGNTPYPVLTSSVPVRNLTIDDGATVTVGANTLTINGAFASSGAGGLSVSDASNIVTNATTDLRFVSSANTLKNLNVNVGTTTITNTLNVTGGSTPGGFGTVTVASGATLASAGNLVLKSNANGTARVAAGSTAGNYITGEVTVERYIPANLKRAWRLLSIPTKGTQTVKGSWQENQAPTVVGTAGLGTLVTSNLTNPALYAAGFDFTTLSPNIQRYNSGTQRWDYLTSTNVDAIETTKAYFLYVRGDRTVTPSESTSTLVATVLRTKGTLYQGNLTAEAISVGVGKFEPVGNLYASAIDFTGLTRTGGVSSTFYIWDPKAGVANALGAYQTFNPLNDYKPFLPGSYGTAVGGASPFRRNTLIESGQGMMVTASGSAGTISLLESAKTAGTGQNVFRPTAGIQKLKTNLYKVEGATETLVDGNLAAFDAAFSNNVDGDDALKFANTNENFGIDRSNTKLVVEARQPVITKDTVFFDMWNMSNANYKIEFKAEEMSVVGLTAVLKDKYLGTTTPMDLTGAFMYHNFTVDANPASKDISRFAVIFTQAAGGALPVNFISLSANRTGAAVKVDWKVGSENAIRHYEIQRSNDGRTFNTAGTVVATGTNTAREIAYTWLDATPFSGTSFYRVKSVGVAGEIKYTTIAKVAGGDIKPAYTISPNPVEGSTVNLQFKNQPQGRYNINLITSDGKVIFTTVAEHAGGNSTQILNLPSFIARGAYQVEIVSPEKRKEVQTLFINSTK